MKSVSRATVTVGVALAVFVYEVVVGQGRPAVLSACVTLALVTPAAALDAYRKARSLAPQPPTEDPPK